MKRRDFMRAGVAAVALAAVPMGAMAASNRREATLEDMRRFSPRMALHYDQALTRDGAKNKNPRIISIDPMDVSYEAMVDPNNGKTAVNILRTYSLTDEGRVGYGIGAYDTSRFYEELLAFHNWRTS